MSKVSDFMARNNIPAATKKPAAIVPAPETAVAKPVELPVDDGWHKLAKSALDELREAESSHPHKEKMIATVLAIVDARLAGKSETAVFRQKDTCNVKTWHSSWKHRPAVVDCLTKLTKLAQNWADQKHVRSLETAVKRLQLAAPVAASKLVSLLGSHDPNVQLRAANSVLDRAGVETASKEGQVMQYIMNYLDFSKLSLSQIEALQDARNPADVIEALVQQ